MSQLARAALVAAAMLLGAPGLSSPFSPTQAIAQEGHDAPAGGEHAAHEKGELIAPLKQGLPAMIAAFLVFGVVFVVLKSKAWPKIIAGLDARSDKIRSEIEAAEQARQQAKDALEQYQKSLAQARDEAKKMLDETKAQQQALAADLRAKADVELTAMRDRARKDIDAAKRAAIAEIYTTTANLAADMAGKILQRQWSPADQQRLVEDSLRELQTKAN